MPSPSSLSVKSKKRRRSPSPRNDHAATPAPPVSASVNTAQPNLLRRLQRPIAPAADVQPAWLHPEQTGGPPMTEAQSFAPEPKRHKAAESRLGHTETAQPTEPEATPEPTPFDLDPQTVSEMAAFLREMPSSPGTSSGTDTIEQADKPLRSIMHDLAKEYPGGVQSEYARAYVLATDTIRYVREALCYGSANQKWNHKPSARLPSGEHANRSQPVNQALMRTQFVDRYSGRYLPEREMARFVWLRTHRSEDQRDLALRIQQVFRGAESPDSGDAQPAGAQRADSGPELAALAQEMLQYKPRLHAYTAFAVRAGNDNHMAALAYTDARYRFDPTYTIQLMQMPGHRFCRIGMPAWPEKHWWVIDPWPRNAYPVRFHHHLGYGTAQVLVSKPGKGTPASDQKQRRYEAFCKSMSDGLRDFKENTWPSIEAQTQTIHNCLYPTKAPFNRIYTVLVRQPDVELTPRHYRISQEHEDARIIVADIIKEVKANLKYGSDNQAWNFQSDARDPESASQAQKRFEATSMRLNYLRSPPAGHVSDDEMRRFAKADHRGASRRIDLASKIRRLLPCEPNDGSVGAAPAADSEKSLDTLRNEVLQGKRRLRAYAALGAEVGNCGEFADVSYVLARQRFGPEYTIKLARTAIPEHSFCIVGKNDWPLHLWWVIDPWPRDAYPVLVQHYFAYENVRPGAGKPGKGIAHSPEQQMRYERLRADVARRLEGHRSRTSPNLADEMRYLYNCLYPTANPVKWHYHV